MNKEKLISHIEASNLSKEDKELLVKLLKQNRLNEYIKLIIKLMGVGSVFWDKAPAISKYGYRKCN